jgi:putative ABC transport system permease protein
VNGFWQDARYGLRKLRRSPGFTLLAVLTLALGIGANTAVFSVVYSVLLRPLAYPRADRLVTPAWNYGGAGGLQSNVDISGFRFWRDHSRVFESIAAYTSGGFNLSGAGQAQRVNGQYVSADYFRTLGVEPALGRDFRTAEDTGTGAPVAILSYALWARHFAADPHALGKTIALDGVPYTVVGVMPASFEPISQADLYLPLARTPGPQLGGLNLQVLGRLQSGLSLQQATAGMQLVAGAFKSSHPGKYPPHFGIDLIPLQTYLGMGARNYLLLLFGAVGLVLLIACANVAGLLIARAAGRAGEIGLRLTLGASRGRLVRQLFTESMLLAIAGAAASLPVAYGGLALLLRLIPSGVSFNPLFASLMGDVLTRSSAISINGWSLAFALAAGIFTAVLFGLLPAWQAVDRDVHRTLKEAGLRSTAAASRSRLRSALVVAEMAVTMVLLAGALLLGRTFVNLLQVGPGFETTHLLSVQLWMGGSRYGSNAALADFYQSLADRIDRLPGARAVAVVNDGMPLERGGNFPFSVETVPDYHSADLRSVSPAYFQTLRVQLLAGRGFETADTGSSTPVAIVNRAFARRYFGNRSPLGLHVVIGAPMKDTPYVDPPREIVGVVGDVKSALDQPAEPTVFVSNAQANHATTQLFAGVFPAVLLVRTTGDPLRLAEPVRRAVGALDSSVPVGKIRTMDEVRAAAVGVERFLLTLMGIFAVLALLLAAVGIYGVMAHIITQRTAEIGLRMAIGASPGDVLKMVLGYAGRLTALGIALGVAGAYGLTRLMASLLYGVRATDTVSFAATAALLALVSLAACVVPAWRAMSVDPIVALHYE